MSGLGQPLQPPARLGEQLIDARRAGRQHIGGELGRRRSRIGKRRIRAAAAPGAFRALDRDGLPRDQPVVVYLEDDDGLPPVVPQIG